MWPLNLNASAQPNFNGLFSPSIPVILFESTSEFSSFQNVPQVYLNASRRSTVGFSMPGVWLDFGGGIFSMVQMLLYCVIDKDNAQLTGNVPKLLLSIISLMYDVIFIFQHYICYASRSHGRVERECLINQES